jgi:hypothetical protein
MAKLQSRALAQLPHFCEPDPVFSMIYDFFRHYNRLGLGHAFLDQRDGGGSSLATTYSTATNASQY